DHVDHRPAPSRARTRQYTVCPSAMPANAVVARSSPDSVVSTVPESNAGDENEFDVFTCTCTAASSVFPPRSWYVNVRCGFANDVTPSAGARSAGCDGLSDHVTVNVGASDELKPENRIVSVDDVVMRNP